MQNIKKIYEAINPSNQFNNDNCSRVCEVGSFSLGLLSYCCCPTELTFDIHARLDGHRLGLVVLVEGDAAQHVPMSLSHGGHLHHGGGRPGACAVRLGGIHLRMDGRDFLVT